MYCPNCDTDPREGDRFCRGCGATLEEEEAATSAFCTSCGREAQEGDRFCRGCGKAVGAAAPAPSRGARRRPARAAPARAPEPEPPSDPDELTGSVFPCGQNDPAVQNMLVDAAELLGVDLLAHEDGAWWNLEVVFPERPMLLPDGDVVPRTQVVQVFHDDGETDPGYGHEDPRLLCVLSNVGHLTSTIETRFLLRHSTNILHARLVLEAQEDAPPMITVQGALPVDTMDPPGAAALIEEVALFADVYEDFLFGSDED